MKYCLILALSFPISLKAQTITTISGNGSSNSDGIPATDAKIINPSGFAFDREGNLYFSSVSSHTIRKISRTGIITTIAGTGALGFSGDGGPATTAKLNQPVGIAIDSIDNVFFADGANHRIRRIGATSGIISTVVGGTVGYSGDGGPASSAQLKLPSGLWFDESGSLLISDCGNGRIRKVSKSGMITTVAGNGVSGWGGDGGSATSAKCWPIDVCADVIGNIYFTEWSWGTVRKVSVDGFITTIAGDTTAPHYYNGDGMPATNARIDPVAIAVDKEGSVYISDSYNNRIRKITTDGIIHTVAGNGVGSSTGDGGIAAHATVHTPSGLVLDSCDNLYFGQVNTPRIRKIAFNPECWPVGVDDVSKNNMNVSIYPNPANRELAITGAGINTIVITDAIGKKLISLEYKSTKKTEINISHLPPGMYLVRVNGVWGQRFMKQ